MDIATILAWITVIGILFLIVYTPIWIFKKLFRKSDKTPNPKKSSYSDRIQEAKNELLTSNDSASLPVLNTAEIGYRPVGKESLIAVQNNVAKMEMKSTGTYRTSGASISIPIMKGIRYRVGTGSIRGNKTWQATSHGRLLITDKAVIFEGDQKNERITWGQIADIEFLSDGYQIAKRTGPPRTFSIPHPDPKFAAVLELMLDRIS